MIRLKSCISAYNRCKQNISVNETRVVSLIGLCFYVLSVLCSLSRCECQDHTHKRHCPFILYNSLNHLGYFTTVIVPTFWYLEYTYNGLTTLNHTYCSFFVAIWRKIVLVDHRLLFDDVTFRPTNKTNRGFSTFVSAQRPLPTLRHTVALN